MPMPDKMGLQFTGTQKQDVMDALQTALTILNDIKVVQLTPEERQGAQSAAERRLPYVDNAINNLAPAYPALQPGFMSWDDANSDAKMTGELRQILLLVDEINHRFIDFSLASEHFAYMYMRKFYNVA